MMFPPWNGFNDKSSSSSDTPLFRPQGDLWIKLAQNFSNQPTGTSEFLKDTLEHLLELSDKSATKQD